MEYFVNSLKKYEVEGEQVIMTQGDVGDYFYIVEEGTLYIKINGKMVKACGAGSSFGELALMSGAPRAATITSVTPCAMWRMDRDTFRRAMATSSINQSKKAMEFLRKVEILQAASPSDLDNVAKVVTMLYYNKGDVIVKKGDVGHIFYMIEQGSVTVTEIGSNFTDATLNTGDYFGEHALESGDKRNATIIAAEDCRILALAREDFESAIGPLQGVLRRSSNVRILQSTELLAGLSVDERNRAAQKFTTVNFPSGTKIVSQGSKNSSFYIIKEGTVVITTDESDSVINELGPGQYFNLQALVDEKQGNPNTCTASSDVQCFELTPDALREVVTGEFSALASRAYSARIAELNSAKQFKVDKSDLVEIAVLGQGMFGRVKLVQDKTSKRAFALKILHKKEIIEYKQQENVMNEKNIMLQCHHPFILGLHNTFKDSHRLYLLLEFCNGGELFTVLHTTTRDGVSTPEAKFYCGCVVMALGYLLERSIIYRDLKPENMLVDSTGYVKIIDFGFAKETKDQSFTLCGTPEYMAPEIILARGYDITVDWWAFGILLYECLAGYSPFAGKDQNAICKNIVNRKLSFPNTSLFNKPAKGLIDRLLRTNPKERLASVSAGASPVRNHEWFSDIDFHLLMSKEVKAPWVPTVKDPTDTRFFDGYQVNDEVDTKWRDPHPGWDSEF